MRFANKTGANNQNIHNRPVLQTAWQGLSPVNGVYHCNTKAWNFDLATVTIINWLTSLFGDCVPQTTKALPPVGRRQAKCNDRRAWKRLKIGIKCQWSMSGNNDSLIQYYIQRPLAHKLAWRHFRWSYLKTQWGSRGCPFQITPLWTVHGALLLSWTWYDI